MHFLVAGVKVLNSLPSDVTSASSLPAFKNRLKTYLIRCCYDILRLCLNFLDLSSAASTVDLARISTVYTAQKIDDGDDA